AEWKPISARHVNWRADWPESAHGSEPRRIYSFIVSLWHGHRTAALIYQIVRTAFDLVINTPDVDTNQTYAEHQHAADQQNQQDDSSKTIDGRAGNLVIQGHGSDDDAEQKRQPSQQCDNLQRKCGKRGNGVNGVTEQRPAAPGRTFTCGFRHIKKQLMGGKTHPLDQATEKAAVLLQVYTGLYHFLVQQFEVSMVTDAEAGQVVEHGVISTHQQSAG